MVTCEILKLCIFLIIKRYSKELKPAQITGNKKGLYSGIGVGIMWIIIYVGYGIAFYYGVVLILEDRYKEDKVYTPIVFVIVSR